MTGAPLRFGERARAGESTAHEAADEPSLPAGPPPLRQPSSEPVVARNGKDEQTAPDEAAAADPSPEPTPTKAKRSKTPPEVPAKPKAAPTDLATMRRRERKQAAKRRARKVRRIVRRFDAWSVLKVAFIFNLCVYIVSMVAGVVLWRVADGAGVIENVESFIEDLGAFETYRFEPDLIFQAYALGGAVLAVLATGLIALGAVLFNLISDLVGGIRLTVIEEPGSLPTRRRRSVGSEPEASGTVSEP